MKATGRKMKTNSGDKHTAQESIGACHRIVFEINRNGFVRATQSIQTGLATRAPGVLAEKVRIIFWILFICLVSLLFVEVVEIYTGCANAERRAHYFSTQNLFWNFVDWTRIICLIAVFIELPTYAPFSPESLDMDWASITGTSEFDFESLTVYFQFHLLGRLDNVRDWFGWLLLLWWFRGVGLLEIFPPVQLPVIALIGSTKTIIIFLTFFSFLLVGVSLTMRLWYGSTAFSFHSVGDSMTSVLMAAIGDFRVDDIKKDFRFREAEVLLLIWSLVMGFIVLTMFVAIVDEGFQSAKEQLNPKPITGKPFVICFLLL
jgi:hypothetical protein